MFFTKSLESTEGYIHGGHKYYGIVWISKLDVSWTNSRWKIAAIVGSGGRFITSSCARRMRHLLGGGNSNVFGIFTPLWGRWTHFDSYFFQMGWNHQPVWHWRCFLLKILEKNSWEGSTVPIFGKLFLLEAAVRGSCGGIRQKNRLVFGSSKTESLIWEQYIYGGIIFIYISLNLIVYTV